MLFIAILKKSFVRALFASTAVLATSTVIWAAPAYIPLEAGHNRAVDRVEFTEYNQHQERLRVFAGTTANQSAATKDLQYWEELFFDAPGELFPFKSMATYYRDQSQGALELFGEVAEPVSLQHTASYYATYDNGNPTGCYGLANQFNSQGSPNPRDGGATLIVEEVVYTLSQRGVDLNEYINNNNGILDGLVIIHAGPGGENTSAKISNGSSCTKEPGKNDIWSHVLYRSGITDAANNSYDTKLLIAAETFYDPRNTRDLPAALGVIAHEFGHVLGLPDLYDQSPIGDPGFGVGQYSLMGYGLYDQVRIQPEDEWAPDIHPKSFDPYLKTELGWLATKELDATYCFETVTSTANAEFVWKLADENNPGDYFLLEYRPNTGWDEDLFADGFLLWHIDEESPSQYKCIPGPQSSCSTIHYKVAVVQKDNRYDLETGTNQGDSDDYYIARDVISRSSSPPLKLWDNTSLASEINIVSVTGSTPTVNIYSDPSTIDEGQPRLGGSPPLSLQLGETFSWQPAAENTYGMNFFSLLDPPPGATIDPVNGLVTWTPEAAGDYQLTIELLSCNGTDTRAIPVQVFDEPVAGCACNISQPGLAPKQLFAWFIPLLMLLGWRRLNSIKK